jgi:uncharacterized membrane protein YecN with MAPEG domain
MITPMFAAILAFIFMFLSVRTLRLRRKFKIAVGDSGNPEMLRAVRAHGNFAEYVPLTLLLIYFVEQAQAQPWIVYALGSVLTLGRVSHSYGISQLNETLFFRVFGMACTLNTMGFSALYLIFSRLL